MRLKEIRESNEVIKTAIKVPAAMAGHPEIFTPGDWFTVATKSLGGFVANLGFIIETGAYLEGQFVITYRGDGGIHDAVDAWEREAFGVGEMYEFTHLSDSPTDTKILLPVNQHFDEPSSTLAKHLGHLGLVAATFDETTKTVSIKSSVGLTTDSYQELTKSLHRILSKGHGPVLSYREVENKMHARASELTGDRTKGKTLSQMAILDSWSVSALANAESLGLEIVPGQYKNNLMQLGISSQEAEIVMDQMDVDEFGKDL